MQCLKPASADVANGPAFPGWINMLQILKRNSNSLCPFDLSDSTVLSSHFTEGWPRHYYLPDSCHPQSIFPYQPLQPQNTGMQGKQYWSRCLR